MSSPIMYGVAASASVVLAALLWRTAVSTVDSAIVLSRLAVRDDAVHAASASASWTLRSFPRGLFVLLIFLGCVGVALSTGPILGITAAFLAFAGRRAWRSRTHSQFIENYERMLPVALDGVARSVRSGAGLSAALFEAAHSTPGPVGDDLGRVVREASLGSGLVESLERWASRRDIDAVNICVASLCLTIETGAAQARVMDGVAATLRQSLDAVDRARTDATDAKASAFALTVLPIVVTGPALLFNIDARAFMLGTVVGQSVLASGLLLDALGAYWMHRLIRRSVS